MKIRQVSYIRFSELDIPDHIVENMADGAPFSWGDNDFTLVHPDRVIEWLMHCMSEEDDEEGNLRGVFSFLTDMLPDTYIDMES